VLALTRFRAVNEAVVPPVLGQRAVKNFLAQFDSDKPLPTADQLRQQADALLETYPDQEENLRQELVVRWQRYFGNDRAPQAGTLLMRLRSPLDRLESKNIPSDMWANGWLANLSKHLVAIVNDPEASTPIGVALSPDCSTLAIAGKNNTIRLWKLAGAKPEP